MQFMGLAAGVAFLALLILLAGVRGLLRGSWFLGWLKGTLGLSAILLAVAGGLAAYDLGQYQQERFEELTLAQLKINKTPDDRFELNLITPAGRQATIMEGDSWRVDARMLDWQGLASLIGLQPGYRLDRLHTVYSDSSRQVASRYAQAALTEKWPGVIDMWLLAYEHRKSISLIRPALLQSAYHPLADGAEYQIVLHDQQLHVRPVNALAERLEQMRRQEHKRAQ